MILKFNNEFTCLVLNSEEKLNAAIAAGDEAAIELYKEEWDAIVDEVDAAQEGFDFLIESGTTHDNLVELATEGVHHLFAYLGLDLVVQERNTHQELHSRSFELREHVLLHNLFDDGLER